MKSWLATVLVWLVVLSGCAPTSEVETLKLEVAAVKSVADQLKSDYDAYKRSADVEKAVSSMDRIAYLTPGDKGYSSVQTRLGVVTVSFDSIKAYANGSEVTLVWGNTTSAKLTAVTATVEWGRVDDKGFPNNETARKRQHTIEALREGAWTKSSVILEGLPPQDLGFVRVSELSFGSIQLNR